jgi:hypothetical protein
MKRLFFKPTVKYVPLSVKPMPSLLSCLLMDFVGSTFGMIPILGDIIWAPISAVIFWKMFGFRKGFFGGVFSFVEEVIPFFGFIPTFTIMWGIQYFRQRKEIYQSV